MAYVLSFFILMQFFKWIIQENPCLVCYVIQKDVELKNLLRTTHQSKMLGLNGVDGILIAY